MKENLLILGCFVAGIALGLSNQAPDWLHGHDLPMIILSLLILQVGISLGSATDLRQLVRSLNPRMSLLPLFTIAGTLLLGWLALLGHRGIAAARA